MSKAKKTLITDPMAVYGPCRLCVERDRDCIAPARWKGGTCHECEPLASVPRTGQEDDRG